MSQHRVPPCILQGIEERTRRPSHRTTAFSLASTLATLACSPRRSHNHATKTAANAVRAIAPACSGRRMPRYAAPIRTQSTTPTGRATRSCGRRYGHGGNEGPSPAPDIPRVSTQAGPTQSGAVYWIGYLDRSAVKKWRGSPSSRVPSQYTVLPDSNCETSRILPQYLLWPSLRRPLGSP